MSTVNLIASQPMLHPDRLGDLLDCIACLVQVQSLTESHKTRLRAQLQQDISSLFSDPSLLSNPSSQWYEFSKHHIEERLGWFRRDIVTPLLRDLSRLRTLKSQFSTRWNSNQLVRITEQGKLRITQLYETWQRIKTSLENNEFEGPYRMEIVPECAQYLDNLKRIEAMIGMDVGKEATYWRQTSSFDEHWIELDTLPRPSEYLQPSSPLVSVTSERPSSSSASDSDDWDPEYARKKKVKAGRRWMMFWEACIVTMSLIVAIVYSIVMADPQSGFTIGGYILAARTMLFFAKRKSDEQHSQPCKLE
jgi:hypothetical protein